MDTVKNVVDKSKLAAGPQEVKTSVNSVSREQLLAEYNKVVPDKSVGDLVDKEVFNNRPKREMKESEDTDTLTVEQVERFRQIIMASETKFADSNRRKRIEAGVSEISLSDLLEIKEIRQTVPIADQFVVVFRTYSASEENGVTRLLDAQDYSPIYLSVLSVVYRTVLSVYSINGKVLTSCVTDSRLFDPVGFHKKLDEILAYPSVILTDLGVNVVWFQSRVEELLYDPDKLKNG